jgi:TetR/AcrR family transcriptional regulator
MLKSQNTGRRERLRDNLEKTILAQAEKTFAASGFEGSSLADIAEASGVSKQNLIYYFPSKLALYRRVLDDVLDDWLGEMRVLAESPLPPREALGAYLRAKLNFSRRRPHGSRVYALEVITGARTYGGDIKAKVVPALRADIATLDRWIQAGQVRAISAQHLFFIIWAATQSYADFAPQMQLVLNRKSLSEKDFDEAFETLQRLIDAIWTGDQATAPDTTAQTPACRSSAADKTLKTGKKAA